jgi:DNA-directed RNA polymerase specialized sigma24 family protein
MENHRVLREVLRHYTEFRALCAATGRWDIEAHGVRISFLDLRGSLSKLSKRKKEAVFYNVILDKKQKDVAEIMGITTGSVNQYVEQAMLQIAADMWPEGEG